MVLRRSNGFFGNNKNRILNMGRSPNGDYWMASNRGLEEGMPDGRRKNYAGIGLKYVWPRNANELIVSANWGVGLFDLHRFQLVDTLWRERTTTVYLRKDTLYIGTLNGLFQLPPDRSPGLFGTADPFFAKADRCSC